MTTSAQDAHVLADRLDTEAASCTALVQSWQDEKDALLARIDVLTANTRSIVPKHGVAVPNSKDPWGDVTKFQAATSTLDFIHPYPGGHELATGLTGVDQALTRFPGVGIVWNCKVAGKGYTDDEIKQFAKDIQVRAAKAEEFHLLIDAEPAGDRQDRTYSVAVFIADFIRLADACRAFAPDVTIWLVLTGYQFAQRIGQYAELTPHIDGVGAELYWKASGPSADLDAVNAALWARANSKRFALTESGAQSGQYQEIRVSDMYSTALATGAEFVVYYQEDGSIIPVPWPSKITTQPVFDALNNARKL